MTVDLQNRQNTSQLLKSVEPNVLKKILKMHRPIITGLHI